jgi:hypothetical protein
MMLCQFTATDGVSTCIVCGRVVRAEGQITAQCRGQLTAVGEFLIRLPPGDGIAWLTKHTGLAAAWEAFQGEQECRACEDRQQRLNMAWRMFVYRKFAKPIPDSPSETAAACPPRT